MATTAWEGEGAVDLIDELRWAMQLFGLDLGFVIGDQWARPTPCRGWTVRDLTLHLIRDELAVADLVGPSAVRSEAEVDIGPADDLANRWEVAAGRAARAWAAPGALETRVVHPALGAMAGARLAEVRLVENLVHRWDLAQAWLTG